MDRQQDKECVTYEIPSRTITGSVPQLLEELDDMIDALQAVREAVVRRAPKPARPATGDGRVRRALQKLHLISA